MLYYFKITGKVRWKGLDELLIVEAQWWKYGGYFAYLGVCSSTFYLDVKNSMQNYLVRRAPLKIRKKKNDSPLKKRIITS